MANSCSLSAQGYSFNAGTYQSLILGISFAKEDNLGNDSSADLNREEFIPSHENHVE